VYKIIYLTRYKH